MNAETKRRRDLIFLADYAEKARTATTDRDALLRELRAEGMSFRALAAECGLSHTAVAKIVARVTLEKEGRQP